MAKKTPKINVRYSPWLRFYRCPACLHGAEKESLRDPTGPCPKCGDDSLEFLVGRWKIEWSDNTFWEDFWLVIQGEKWTPEFK